jgi:serine/threonine protein kinase
MSARDEEEKPPRPPDGNDGTTRETTFAALPSPAGEATGVITTHAIGEPEGAESHDYVIIERVSDGGQATVFKARARETGEIVALKMFKSAEEDQQSEQQFKREVQILSALSHENIVGYKGAFTAEGEWGEARKCLVMEFLDGVSLKEYVEQHPNGVPWADASAILEQVLRALIFAHDEKGITHRDIKPSNIFILSSGVVKIIDFGIARLNTSGTRTGGAGLMGSFDYMAPDFARVKDPDFRGDEVSDIFSLFVCFFEMITGRLPFPKVGERQELDYLHRWSGEAKPAPTDAVIFRVITHLSRFIQKGLEPDRAKRYQHLTEVLQDFGTLKPRVIVHGSRERYVLTDALGSGGFSEVYKARRESDGATVAIKRLFANRSLDRFIKEAEVLSLHPHPNVVQYYDFFESVSSSGRADSFLVMEYLDGMPGWSLRERIKEHPDGLPVDEVVETFGYYLSTLAYLYHHKHSVVHRDIKPANLYAPEGQPAKAKLLDFGGARDLSGTKTTGSLPGTWDYMAPEFVTTGSRGTHQSDLYALGLSFYEALTGKPAFPRLPRGEREALNEYIERAKGIKKLHIDFGHVVFEKYPELTDVIRRSTAREVKARYTDAMQMRESLDKILSAHFGRTLPEAEAPPAAAAEPAAKARLNPFRVAHVQRRRHAIWRAVRLTALLALLGAAGWLAWQVRREVAAAVSQLVARVRPKPAPAGSAVPGTEPSPTAVVASYMELAPTVAVATTTTPAPESKPEPVVPPEVERRTTLLRELQLALEPLTYFVAAGSKYEMVYADVAKSAATLRKTLASAKYSEVSNDPAIVEMQVTIWRDILREVLTIMREQKSPALLPLARGCFHEIIRLRIPATPPASLGAVCKNELEEAQKLLPEGDARDYFLFPQSDVLRIATRDDGAWKANEFLDDVFARPECSDLRARILPHRAELGLSVQANGGRVTRRYLLPLALVPDGDSGLGYDMEPLYLATIETPLEAIRCYRDDAPRWDAASRKLFSGNISGRTSGPNDLPFFQARPEEAMEFCNWASALAGRPAVYARNGAGSWTADLRQPGFRLPTVKEWEYAARYGFDIYRKPGARAWNDLRKGLQDNTLVYYYFKREPRASSAAAPYPLGPRDMSGNVEEICMLDGPPSEPFEPRFVLKGGSAKSRTDTEVLPTTEGKAIDSTHELVGFRVALGTPFARF